MSRGGLARSPAVLAVAFVVASWSVGCGGSDVTASSSPSSKATSRDGPRVVAPAGWGLQFVVDERLSKTEGPGPEGVVVFHSRLARAGGSELVVGHTQLPEGITVRKTLRLLRTPGFVRDVLPGGTGQGADVKLVRRPARVSVGPGWPGASARYSVTVAAEQPALWDQREIELEIVLFRQDDYLVEVFFLVAPAADYASWRDAFEITRESIQAAE